MSKEKKPITIMWKRAKRYVEEHNEQKAMPLLETMIIYLAKLSLKEVREIEGLKVDLWKERAWQGIEQLGLLPEYKETEGRQLGSIMSR
jgi:dihydroneopterin aldolase